jgi:hypothetical protein
VAADCAQLDTATDDALLTNDLYTPGLRRLGDFATAATLAAPHPLLLHNTGAHFTGIDWIGDVYHALGAKDALHVEPAPLSTEAIVSWLGSQK